jgi:hypothetical protein
LEQGSAAKVGEEPEKKREADAQDEARDDWKVERGVFAAMDDVAGKAAEAKRQLFAEVRKSPDKGQECVRVRGEEPSNKV